MVIIGAGTVGTNAARVALGMGAHVSLIDISVDDSAFGRSLPRKADDGGVQSLITSREPSVMRTY